MFIKCILYTYLHDKHPYDGFLHVIVRIWELLYTQIAPILWSLTLPLWHVQATYESCFRQHWQQSYLVIASFESPYFLGPLAMSKWRFFFWEWFGMGCTPQQWEQPYPIPQESVMLTPKAYTTEKLTSRDCFYGTLSGKPTKKYVNSHKFTIFNGKSHYFNWITGPFSYGKLPEDKSW